MAKSDIVHRYREKRAVNFFFLNKVFRVFEPPYEQFGLLIFHGERSLKNISQMELRPPYNQPPKSKITYPEHKDDYINYIYVPFCYSDENPKGTHAEVILLSKLEQLQRRYQEEHGSIPKHVILYTYNSPCDECTPLIVDKREEVATAAFTLMYTKEYDKWPLESAEDELTKGDIEMQHVSKPRK